MVHKDKLKVGYIYSNVSGDFFVFLGRKFVIRPTEFRENKDIFLRDFEEMYLSFPLKKDLSFDDLISINIGTSLYNDEYIEVKEYSDSFSHYNILNFIKYSLNLLYINDKKPISDLSIKITEVSKLFLSNLLSDFHIETLTVFHKSKDKFILNEHFNIGFLTQDKPMIPEFPRQISLLSGNIYEPIENGILKVIPDNIGLRSVHNSILKNYCEPFKFDYTKVVAPDNYYILSAV